MFGKNTIDTSHHESWITFFILFLYIATFSACSSAPIASRTSERDSAKEYAMEKERLEKIKIISPGFTLRIHHVADAEISGEYKVTLKGMVKLPYKVNVLAAGLTTDALAETLMKAYSPYFKARNSVTVEIVAREYLIEVRGLVQKPGQYYVKLDTSIEEVIALSGGLPGASSEGKNSAGTAKPEYIRLVRPGFMNPTGTPFVQWVRLTDYFLKYDVRNEILWRGGEQLFFQMTGDPDALKSSKSQTVQIMGEVHKPGEYPIQPGNDLLTYIAQAGGPTSTADLGSVTIVLKDQSGSSSIDLTKSTRVVELSAGDVILVKSTQTKASFFEKMGPVLISLGSLAVSVFLVILTL